jgi:hypothetical protein
VQPTSKVAGLQVSWRLASLAVTGPPPPKKNTEHLCYLLMWHARCFNSSLLCGSQLRCTAHIVPLYLPRQVKFMLSGSQLRCIAQIVPRYLASVQICFQIVNLKFEVCAEVGAWKRGCFVTYRMSKVFGFYQTSLSKGGAWNRRGHQ